MKRKAIPLVLKFGIFASIWLPGLLLGQQAAGVILPPTLGFVFDSGSRTVKPILGIPGASLLGTPLDIGIDLADTAISPRHDYALLLTGDRHEVKLLQLAASDAPVSSIEGAMTAPDLVTLSPTGSAAVLYRASDGLAQVLGGLPASPHILREIPCASLGDALTSVAVADDGQMLLAAVANTVVLIPSNSAPSPLPIEGPIAAMAFRPRTHAAIVASHNQVSLIPEANDMSGIQLLAGPDDGILDPAAVEFSFDGLHAFIANSGGNLVQFDLSGAAPPQSLSCQCKMTGLHRLAGNSVFRLTDPSDGPLVVFDGDAAQARMVFVPAASAGGANGAQ